MKTIAETILTSSSTKNYFDYAVCSDLINNQKVTYEENGSFTSWHFKDGSKLMMEEDSYGNIFRAVKGFEVLLRIDEMYGEIEIYKPQGDIPCIII